VDLGGTWLRVRALNARGRMIKEVRTPAPRPEDLATALRRVWKKWGLSRLPLLTVGSKGVWKREKKRSMERSLAGLADRVVVMSDVEAAYRQKLGDRPGVLLLAGTGSIALARDREGRWHRAGGLGPAKGDEGSGYWIGREYRARVLRKKLLSVTPANVRRVAALATKALQDPRAREIVQEAQNHLASLARKLLPMTRAPGKTAMATFGGLMDDPAFRRGVLARLRSKKSG
jgi:N-acetylglucosamine kinase-like BadF-type ATPase